MIWTIYGTSVYIDDNGIFSMSQWQQYDHMVITEKNKCKKMESHEYINAVQHKNWRTCKYHGMNTLLLALHGVMHAATRWTHCPFALVQMDAEIDHLHHESN